MDFHPFSSAEPSQASKHCPEHWQRLRPKDRTLDFHYENLSNFIPLEIR
jgi:hypothetical protein